MNNPFRCGPNPCGWTCRDIPPVSCDIWSFDFPTGWSTWSTINGSFTEQADSIYTNNTGMALCDVPANNNLVVMSCRFSMVAGFGQGQAKLFIKSNATGTAFFMGLVDFSGPTVRVGDQNGILASSIIPLSPSGEVELLVCYNGSSLTAKFKDQEGNITTVNTTIADNGQFYAGFGATGNGFNSFNFYKTDLYIHNQPGYENCPECDFGTCVISDGFGPNNTDWQLDQGFWSDVGDWTQVTFGTEATIIPPAASLYNYQIGKWRPTNPAQANDFELQIKKTGGGYFGGRVTRDADSDAWTMSINNNGGPDLVDTVFKSGHPLSNPGNAITNFILQYTTEGKVEFFCYQAGGAGTNATRIEAYIADNGGLQAGVNDYSGNSEWGNRLQDHGFLNTDITVGPLVCNRYTSCTIYTEQFQTEPSEPAWSATGTYDWSPGQITAEPDTGALSMVCNTRPTYATPLKEWNVVAYGFVPEVDGQWLRIYAASDFALTGPWVQVEKTAFGSWQFSSGIGAVVLDGPVSKDGSSTGWPIVLCTTANGFRAHSSGGLDNYDYTYVGAMSGGNYSGFSMPGYPTGGSRSAINQINAYESANSGNPAGDCVTC